MIIMKKKTTTKTEEKNELTEGKTTTLTQN